MARKGQGSDRGTDRRQALETALAQIHKQYGAGSIIRMGQDRPAVNVGTVSTGSLAIDIASGIGGLPRGRVTEIYGPESSGKTTLALTAAASAQSAGGTVAFIDAEHALDPKWAATIGVDVDDLYLSQPDTGDQALEITDQLVRSGGVDLIVVDSVSALTPKAELEGDMGDSHVGLQARLMSQGLRKLTHNIKQTGTVVIFINQIRMKIGVAFGSPETTSGGNALKFYASMRIDVRRIGSVKRHDDIIGNETRVKFVKNKVAAPFRQAETKLFYSTGFSRPVELLEQATRYEVIRKSGSWYAYGDIRIGQGWEQAARWIAEHPDEADAIDHRIRVLALPETSETACETSGALAERGEEGRAAEQADSARADDGKASCTVAVVH